MPVAKFRMEDGRIARFEVPEGTTPEQAQSMIASFVSSQSEALQAPRQAPQETGLLDLPRGGGRGASASRRTVRREAEREQFLSSLDPSQRSLIEDVGPVEAFGIGAGRGLTTLGRAVGLAEPEDPAVTQSIENLRRIRGGVTAGEIAGEAAPFLLPGGAIAKIASVPIRAAATAGLGATEGGLIAKGQGRGIGETLFSAGIGGTVAGALELGLPVLGRVAGSFVRRVTGQPPKGALLDAAGNPTPEFQSAMVKENLTIDDFTSEAIQELGGKALDPRQAARKGFLESQGLEPTQAQISREASEFQTQQEAAKTSGRVRESLEAQEAFLSSRFDNAVLETGGEAATPTSTVTDALVDKASALDTEISALYKQAREVAPGEKNVKLEGLADKLRELAPSNRRAGGNIETVVGDLQAKGVLDSDMKLVGRIDVETAEDVRKLTNELFDPQNAFGNSKLRELKEALDDDVFKAAGEDVFNAGRKAKRDFEQGLSRAKINKFDSRKKNLVRDMLENKDSVNPEDFTNKVVFSKSWRGSDLEQLKDYLQDAPNGQNAFNDLRADVLNSIKEKSFIGAEDAAGVRALSRDKLQKALSSVGREKMNVLFSVDEQKFLRDMLKVAKLREPVRGTVLGKGPTAQAVGDIKDALLSNPILKALASGVTFDSQGRAVIKGSAQRLPNQQLGLPARQAIQATAIGGAAAAQPAQAQEQE